ncbi:MAG: pantoate--beta-alanine ligase [Terracidiphilus sp.]
MGELTRMEILRTVDDLRGWSRAARAESGNIVGLVPTMGALHAGHASLIRAARAACMHVGVSLFVNPTQFGPGEDYARYPRSFEADCALAEAEGADVLFAPSVEELYPNGPVSMFVDVPDLSGRLDGASRPGHFRGVTTVVAKLLIAAEPDRAFFGQKDAAQVAVVRRMVADLGLATEIVACPIVRDADGLALSSRNAYLSPAERAQALTLSRAVRHVESLVAGGERRGPVLIEAAHGDFADARSAFGLARSALGSESEVRIDYIALVDWATLEPVEIAVPGTLFAVAAYVGTTRLIDNAILK